MYNKIILERIRMMYSIIAEGIQNITAEFE